MHLAALPIPPTGAAQGSSCPVSFLSQLMGAARVSASQRPWALSWEPVSSGACPLAVQPERPRTKSAGHETGQKRALRRGIGSGGAEDGGLLSLQRGRLAPSSVGDTCESWASLCTTCGWNAWLCCPPRGLMVSRPPVPAARSSALRTSRLAGAHGTCPE